MNGEPGVQKHPRFKIDAEVELVASMIPPGTRWAVENISLGGLFVRTPRPVPAGTAVKVRMQAATGPIVALAKVVHVIDPNRAAVLQTNPGMGVQFHEMPPEARDALVRFVDGLAEQAMRRADGLPKAPEARFVSPAQVDVRIADAQAAKRLWHEQLSRHGLYAKGAAPPVRAVVSVRFLHDGGQLVVRGEVVARVPEGVGLQLVDFDGDARALYVEFMEGRSPSLAPAAMSATATTVVPAAITPPAVQAALSAARVLFDGLGKNDPQAALGLRKGAPPEVEDARIAELKRTFQTARAGATATQVARVEHALKAVQKLERHLALERALSRRQAEMVQRPKAEPALDAGRQAEALRRRADEDERRGDLAGARKALERAAQMVPFDVDVRAALARVSTLLDEAKAADDVAAAEVYCEHASMKQQAKGLATSAIGLSAQRPIRARALKVLLKIDAANEAFALAQDLLATDPGDEVALMALLILYERKGHVTLAARTCARLCELRPNDKDLKARLKKLRGLLGR